MRKLTSRFPAIIIAVLPLLYFLFSPEPAGALKQRHISAKVVRVHDGDTLSVMIGTKREKVRLIGIDAPEIGQRPWGAKAKRHLESLLGSPGGIVGLELDVEERDKYGRVLGYIHTADGQLINLEMVKAGYAALFTFPPNIKYTSQLIRAQDYARRPGLGIWGKKGMKEMPGDYRKKHPR